MFPLTPDQHHWLEVATEDEGCLMYDELSCDSCTIFVPYKLSSYKELWTTLQPVNHALTSVVRSSHLSVWSDVTSVRINIRIKQQKHH